MTDDRLLRRAQRGDRDALEELCTREWRGVYGVVYQAVGNRPEAQDLTQEAFLRALRSLDQYRHTGVPFSAWLATIPRNLVRDRRRMKRPVTVNLAKTPDIPSRLSGPEERAIQSSERRRLLAAIESLSPDHQAVIRLRMLDGLPATEVARIMNRNPAAVRQLQRRALTALRSQLLEESQP
jgi:RNA polymerase sigma-70 factor, ECF subfamily